jgi:hypothetical protein
VQLQRPAPDRVAVEPGEQQESGRLGQLVGVGGDAPAGIETGLKALLELDEKNGDGVISGVARGMDDLGSRRAEGGQTMSEPEGLIRTVQ